MVLFVMSAVEDSSCMATHYYGPDKLRITTTSTTTTTTTITTTTTTTTTTTAINTTITQR